MRVVDRETFLSLPDGTIYCKGVQWAFEGLNIKRENAGKNDWYAGDPAWVDASSSDEAISRLEEMLARGARYPMQDDSCRDGLFDADAIFLVLEKPDLLVLRGWIDAALAIPRPPDDAA